MYRFPVQTINWNLHFLSNSSFPTKYLYYYMKMKEVEKTFFHTLEGNKNQYENLFVTNLSQFSFTQCTSFLLLWSLGGCLQSTELSYSHKNLSRFVILCWYVIHCLRVLCLTADDRDGTLLILTSILLQSQAPTQQ